MSHEPCEGASESKRDNGPTHEGETILDLLGLSAGEARYEAGREADSAPVRTGADDVLADLSRQYYRALDARQVPTVEWVDAGAPASGVPAQKLSDESRAGDEAFGSITGLLSDIEKLEEAFGPLHESDLESVAEQDEISEILTLFAPPEYQAAAARRMGAVPPLLARRDHHALAIDSPMVALNGHAKAVPQQSE